MKNYAHVWYLAEFFLEWEMFQTKVAQKIKTQILCSITFSQNSAAYETMWKNTVVRHTKDDNTIWHIYFACWITKATDTHS